jgi:hypothetical protein
MVGEACAYVQGESAKARAALLTECFSTPRSPMGSAQRWRHIDRCRLWLKIHVLRLTAMLSVHQPERKLLEVAHVGHLDYADDTGHVGPLTLQQLKDALSAFSDTDVLVWCDRFDDWKPAKDVPELKSQTAFPPPLPMSGKPASHPKKPNYRPVVIGAVVWSAWRFWSFRALSRASFPASRDMDFYRHARAVNPMPNGRSKTRHQQRLSA